MTSSSVCESEGADCTFSGSFLRAANVLAVFGTDSSRIKYLYPWLCYLVALLVVDCGLVRCSKESKISGRCWLQYVRVDFDVRESLSSSLSAPIGHL